MKGYNDRAPREPGEGQFHSYRRALRRAANIIGGGLMLYYVIIVATDLLLEFASQYFSAHSVSFAGWALVALDILKFIFSTLRQLAPCLFMVRMLRIPARIAFPGRAPSARLTVPGIFCTLGMSVFGIYISAVISEIIKGSFGVTPTMPDFNPPYGMTQTIIYMLSLSLIPAIVEEMLFRGVIMQALRRFGDSFALVASSILFAFLHGNLVQGPNAFLVGLVLGYFALRTGSIFTSMIMHFANNALAAMLIVASLYLPQDVNVALNFAAMPFYLALGVLGIIIMVTQNGGFIRPLREDGEPGAGIKHALFFTSPAMLVFIAATLWIVMQFTS